MHGLALIGLCESNWCVVFTILHFFEEPHTVDLIGTMAVNTLKVGVNFLYRRLCIF